MGRRRGDTVLSRLITLRIITAENFPINDQGVWGWPQASQPRNPAQEDDTLKCLTLNINTFISGNPEDCGKYRLHFKSVHRKFHMLWNSGQRQQFGATFIIFESLLERQEESEACPDDIDMRDTHFGEFVLPHGHWCWQESIWNPLSSFLVLGPSPTTAHQPVSTNTERPQAKQVAGQGQSLTHWWAGYLKKLKAHSYPWT